MTKFSLERRIPTCLVNKVLLSAIERYLTVEMRQKLGDVLGDKITYRISIEEDIGTETLGGVEEYTPSIFPDGTKLIKIDWEN
jgi:hypothetical protein